MRIHGIVSALLILSTSALATELPSDAPTGHDGGKWNGYGLHPDKVMKYLHSKDMEDCGLLYMYYQPKGSIAHSPNLGAVAAAYCVMNVELGAGAAKEPGCRVGKVDWKAGRMIAFYDGQAQLEKRGACKQSFKELLPELGRQAKAMKSAGAKPAVIDDYWGFGGEFLKASK